MFSVEIDAYGHHKIMMLDQNPTLIVTVNCVQVNEYVHVTSNYTVDIFND